MEAYDLARKLEYAGLRSPVPFVTSPEYTNSVPGVPVLSMLRIFVEPEHLSDDGIKLLAREVSRVLGSDEQFDVGITTSARRTYDPEVSAAGITGRIMKLNREDPVVTLRMSDGITNRVFTARYPALQFEPEGEGTPREENAPGILRQSQRP